MEKRIYYLSNTVIPNTKREKNVHVFNVFTQIGVKQLTDFLNTVTAASDLVDCTLVNCDDTAQIINVHQKEPMHYSSTMSCTEKMINVFPRQCKSNSKL